MNDNETRAAQPFVRRTRKVFYHPNGKGTGSALQLELHPAHEDTEGSVFLTMAPQRTIGMRTADDTVHPTFDWRNSVCLKLDLMDLAQILQVMRGVQESLADGKGLFHRSSNASAIIKFEHRIEPVPGYLLDVSKKPLTGDLLRVNFFFRPAEAFACALMLEQALVYVAFGIPTVIPRMRPAPIAAMPVETVAAVAVTEAISA
jgi:hypothetical protein